MSAAPAGGLPVATEAPGTATRPFWWSVRRELWENRSIWIAPLAVAAVVLVATSIATVRALGPASRPEALVRPFQMSPAPIMLATFLVGLFYALDALYGERRDRSILFWKSLPVSDLTTVLAKACVPLAVLPSIAFVLCVAVQLVLLVVVFAVALAGGAGPGLWAELGFVEGLPIMAYGLAVHALWFAPFYGWLLLVSAWARRVPLLWAVLPLLAVAIVERITAGTPHFTSLLRYRVTGAMSEAFTASGAGGDVHGLDQLDPVRFLTAPGLWLGLLFTVACLAAAVRLRRRREPN